MMFLKEMPDTVHFIENRLVKLDRKIGSIDAINARLDGLSIKKLIFRVDSLEGRVT